MADMMHQPRDENGQFSSLEKLFERERADHAQDHEQERVVAKETAQRLEREVEQTALRIDRAVQTALMAVGETARVHADAHGKEHVAHERIHAVEKTQVDKAEREMNKRLEGMNEFRATLADQAGRLTPREMFEQRATGVDGRLNNIEKIIVGRDAFNSALESRDKQIALLESFQAKALGFGALVAILSGAVGAAIARAFS